VEGNGEDDGDDDKPHPARRLLKARAAGKEADSARAAAERVQGPRVLFSLRSLSVPGLAVLYLLLALLGGPSSASPSPL
jgi:hypothetical protein